MLPRCWRIGASLGACPVCKRLRVCRGQIRSYAGTFSPGPLKISISAYQGVLTVRAWDFAAPDWHRAEVVFDGIYFFAD